MLLALSPVPSLSDALKKADDDAKTFSLVQATTIEAAKPQPTMIGATQAAKPFILVAVFLAVVGILNTAFSVCSSTFRGGIN